MVIGIAGRSGSGKTSLVRRLLEEFGSYRLSLHTMDNYYLPRSMQKKDSRQYYNFDLPESFYRQRFFDDLKDLMAFRPVQLTEYVFNNESDSQTIEIQPSPVILVEGLFVFHYPEIAQCLHHKVLVNISYQEALRRRIERDLNERNYGMEEIMHRYNEHAEPAYAKFIAPYSNACDVIVENENNFETGMDQLREIIRAKLSNSGS